jgi:sugar phosphate isomerase/epimerase
MHLGISTWAYAWAIGVPGYDPPAPMDHFQFLRRASDLGVSLVQIADNLPVHTLSAEQLDAFESEAQRLALSIELGTRGIAHDLLRTYLDLCHRFQSPILRTVTDAGGQEPPVEEIVDTVRAIIPEFEQAGVTLAIENHDRLSAAEFERIIQAVDSPSVGICLDTVNSFGALEGPEVVVKTLAPYTVNLHIKDFEVRRADFITGFRIAGRPAGQGRLNIPWLLDQLRPHGRNPNAILEQWPYPEPTIEDTIRKEDDWAAESIRYLKTVIG